MAHRRSTSSFIYCSYCSFVLTISLPFIQIQASPAVSAGKGMISWQEEQQQIQLLEPGKPIERDLAGRQSHPYQMTLASGQSVKLRVDQRGIDVLVKLSGPSGQLIADFDYEHRVQGEEFVTWVAEEVGIYRLEVVSKYKNAAAGQYRIQVVELGVATENDRALHEARKLNTEFIRLNRAGKYAEARVLCERVLEIREKALGQDHPDVAQTITNLAVIYYNLKGDFAKAEQLFQRALSIREKVLGPEHPDVAASLNNLARVYYALGEFAKAESFYERALTISEKSLGSAHPDVAATLINFANLCLDISEYTKAESLFQRALVIYEGTLEPDNSYFAIVLKNLAALYNEIGNYAKAEPLLQRALNIDEKVHGQNHPDVANSLINLAYFYYKLGDFEKAEPLYLRALTIREKALGAAHPDIARPLENLADLYTERGEYEKAEPLYTRALEISEKALGPEHPFIALTLNIMAKFYSEKGDYAKAEPLFQRALAIAEKTVGPAHPGVAEVLNNLANLYRCRGDYAEAEPLYRRALDINEKALGKETLGQDHPRIAETLTEMARLYAAKGDYTQAIVFLSRANAIEEDNFRNALAIGSERQKLLYLAKFSDETYFTLSLQGQAAPDNAQALKLAFNTILSRKGRGLDAMTDTIAALRRNAAPQDRERFDKLKDARSQLATLMLEVPDADKLEIYRKRIKKLKDKVDDLEGELSSRSVEFRKQVQPITLTAVQATLPAQSALVEFAYFMPQLPNAVKEEQPRYRAYVLPSRGEAKWVDLGEADRIDRAIEAWRNALRDPNRSDVNRLARAVDEKLMRPVRSLLDQPGDEASRLLIAPDGMLNLVPFAALRDEKNRYLIERYSISYLTCGRDLLRFQTSEPSKDPPLVMANPDFGRLATVAMRGDFPRARARDRSGAQMERRQFFFQPLPATEDEALAIKALLPNASVLQREDATEKALKEVRGPQILHIATHGFFLKKKEPPPAEGAQPPVVSSEPDKPDKETGYTVQLEATPVLESAQKKVRRLKAQGVDAYILKSRAKRKRNSEWSSAVIFRVRTGKFPIQADAQKYGADLVEKGFATEFFVTRSIPEPHAGLRISVSAAQVKDPLLRSGLALAGANLGKSGDNDGILTALEAASLDLSGTKLVVLSACDTGVGDIKEGEGVQGLRRALVLAGSESQVMSLWPVSDEATKELMVPYYVSLQQGQGRSDGLRQVQLRMLRGRKDRQHPFYWAAFIESGEWTKLDGLQ
jgi:CHAT domain-containing protein/Tfp pilus assembly protein PilF